MAKTSDETIMNRVKNGDLAELSVLFERYHVKFYNFMLKLTFDRTASHDLTQDLFYRILKYRHTYREDKSFKSWAYQMARNVHIDYCKQKQKLTDQFTDTEKYYADIAEEIEAYDQEEFDRLDKALSMLSPDQKEIIVLSRFQGLKCEEISSINNQSVSSVKVQIHRAIKQLRQIYFELV